MIALRCKVHTTGLLTAAVVLLLIALFGIIHFQSERGLSEKESAPSLFLEKETLVHFLRLFPEKPVDFHDIKPDAPLSFMECMSMMSVLVAVQNPRILIHSNKLNIKPQSACEELFGESIPNIEIRPYTLRKAIGNKTIRWMSHEADIAKVHILLKEGGVALDFDVYILNIEKLLTQSRRKNQCVVGRDNHVKLNMGFMICPRNAPFLKNLWRYYETDYRPYEWIYNAGEIPSLIEFEHPDSVIPDVLINGYPCWFAFQQMFDRKLSLLWNIKAAHHTFYHNHSYTKTDALAAESDFGDMLRMIWKKGRTQGRISALPHIP